MNNDDLIKLILGLMALALIIYLLFLAFVYVVLPLAAVGGAAGGVYFVSKWWYKAMRQYEHTPASMVALALLFPFLCIPSFVLTQILRWDWRLSPAFAIPLWLVSSLALVKIVAWNQPEARERRRLVHEYRRLLALLERYDAKIEGLKRQKEALAEKHKAPLSRKEKLEREISSLIAPDPANLGLKVSEFKRRAQGLSASGLREQADRVKGDLEEIRKSKQRAKDKLSALEREGQTLETRRREAEWSLRELEMADLSNVEMQIRHLRSEWGSLSQAELEAVKPSSKVGRLLKEGMLLRHAIQANSWEAERLRYEIDDTCAENVLLLEKRVLEEEEIDRVLRRDEPQLLQIEAQLSTLEIERQRLKKLLGSTFGKVKQDGQDNNQCWS